MKNVILIGGVSALTTGVIIGLQSMLSGRAEGIIGAVNTGFWTNFLGGSLAGLLMLIVGAIAGFDTVKITRPALAPVLISGALGIMIIMGVSFSISRAGVAAGLATMLWGQMAFGALADSLGWGGIEPIPLDIKRILGLALMAVSILLLLPKE